MPAIKNDLDNILKLMELKMLDKCHIFKFMNSLKGGGEYDTCYEPWVQKGKNAQEMLLQKVEAEFRQYDEMKIANYSDTQQGNGYSKTGIEFFIENLASDEEYFERVARLSAKIYGGNVSKDNSFVRYDVSKDVKSWIFDFFRIFQYVKNANVDVLQRIALERIILNFNQNINVFDVLFLLNEARKDLNELRPKNKIKDTKSKELTVLNEEFSRKLVDKIITDKFCAGSFFKMSWRGYNYLEEHGKINFVSQILQEIGLEIHVEEKKRLFNE